MRMRSQIMTPKNQLSPTRAKRWLMVAARIMSSKLAMFLLIGLRLTA
jgi:hypothetical protein